MSLNLSGIVSIKLLIVLLEEDSLIKKLKKKFFKFVDTIDL
jgi:hypothetical protein